MSSLLETFREILAQHDLLPEDILADGNLYRCPTRNKPYKRNGAYIVMRRVKTPLGSAL